MAVIKQKTTSVGNQKQTVQLKQLQNDFDEGGQYMYSIVDADTGGRIEDPLFRKREAIQEFNQTVRDIERGMKSKQSEPSGRSSFGGGSRPGSGAIDGLMGDTSKDRDDGGWGFF